MFARRWRFVCIALLAPLLGGAYFDSCRKTTVGFWPNHPWVRANTAPSTAHARGLASEAHVHGATLFLPWTNVCNHDAATPCYTAGTGSCSTKRNNAAIESYVRGFVEQWNASAQQSLNLHIVVPIHVPSSTGVWGLGPECNRGNGLDSSALRKELFAFVSVALSVLKKDSRLAGLPWAIAIGNEVDLYLSGGGARPPTCVGTACGSWQQYAPFLKEMRALIHPSFGGFPVGASVTWDAMLRYDDRLRTYTFGPNLGSLRSLMRDSQADAAFVTYYPVTQWDAARPFQALPPRDVGTHLSTVAFVAQLLEGDRGAFVPIFLQEVGYTTDGLAHLHYSGFTDGKAAQRRFVIDFFEALHAQRKYIRGASWWSLYDWTDSQCNGFWPVELRHILCRTGLRDSAGNEKSVAGVSTTAWDEFVIGARKAEAWAIP